MFLSQNITNSRGQQNEKSCTSNAITAKTKQKTATQLYARPFVSCSFATIEEENNTIFRIISAENKLKQFKPQPEKQYSLYKYRV